MLTMQFSKTVSTPTVTENLNILWNENKGDIVLLENLMYQNKVLTHVEDFKLIFSFIEDI